jgi:hypothetical protein
VEKSNFQYDIFISHASEDKDGFVRPLANKLKEKGYRIWYDEFSLTIGDSLSRTIDKGLAESRFGIIVISPKFMEKPWTQWELQGLVQKQVKDGKKVILPIWHNVSQQQVSDFSAPIADILAVNSSYGLDNVINQIVEALKQADVVLEKPYDPASERGIDYTKLCELLEAKNWLGADKETYRLMIEAVGKRENDMFTSDDILNFPCTVLHEIDRLWVKYSNGHFGFSVQKEIYLSVGGKADGNPDFKSWLKFGNRIGWRNKWTRKWILYSECRFDISSPKGHLPGWGAGVDGAALFFRVETCKL